MPVSLVRFGWLFAAYCFWLGDVLPLVVEYYPYMTWTEIALCFVCTMGYPIAIRKEVQP